MIGLLFDLDGVLIDSAEYHFASWRQLAAEHGRDFPAAFFYETFGMPNRQILPLLFAERTLSDAEIGALGERKEAHYRAMIAAGLDWAPGAESLVRAAHADSRVRLGLYTSTPRSNLAVIGERLGFPGLFDAMLTGDDVRRGKPAPDGWQLLAERLGVAPRRCVVLEDAPPGIAAGRAAGIPVIGLATTHTAADIAAADWVVVEPGALNVPAIRAWLDAGAPRRVESNP